MTVHYSQSCCHDEDETWCGWPSGSVANGQYVPPPAGRYSRDLAEVDCEACFLAVAAEAR